MSEEITVDVELPDPTPLEALRAWYHANKTTPEFQLAMKHKNAMDPAVAAELKSRAPGDSDEEKELGLVFSLTQIASKLDTVQLMLSSIRVEHLPPVAPAPKPELLPAAHVDVTPLDDVPPTDKA